MFLKNINKLKRFCENEMKTKSEKSFKTRITLDHSIWRIFC